MSKQIPWNKKPIEERFWNRVDKTGECWLWTGSAGKGRNAYGTVSAWDHKTWPAHRVAWTLASGPIPDGMLVCHRCDTPRCVRPDHLFLGTASDNQKDSVAKGRAFAQRFPHVAASYFKGRRPKGERSSFAKLTAKQALEVRRRADAGESHEAIALDFPINRAAVGCIARRETWTHLPEDSNEVRA